MKETRETRDTWTQKLGSNGLVSLMEMPQYQQAQRVYFIQLDG